MVLSTYVHAYETTLSDQALSYLSVSNGLKTSTTKTTPNVSLIASDHKLTYWIYHDNGTAYLLIPKELYEKSPQINTNSCKQQYFPFKEFLKLLYLGCLLWIWMEDFIKQKFKVLYLIYNACNLIIIWIMLCKYTNFLLKVKFLKKQLGWILILQLFYSIYILLRLTVLF